MQARADLAAADEVPLLGRQWPSQAPRRTRSARSAVAWMPLLTYGRLDAVDDVLAHLPDGRHPARTLARSVSILVPLPPGLDPLQDAQATAAWIRAHRDELIWRSEDGRFVRGAVSTR
jgi:hypothetical protein